MQSNIALKFEKTGGGPLNYFLDRSNPAKIGHFECLPSKFPSFNIKKTYILLCFNFMINPLLGCRAHTVPKCFFSYRNCSFF